MGTGIDHRPGRTSSTGGMTFSSQAAFCAVPVTTTTTGTVHGTERRGGPSGPPTWSRRPEDSAPPWGPGGGSLKSPGRLPTMRPSNQALVVGDGSENRVGRGAMADQRGEGIVERRAEAAAGRPASGSVHPRDRPGTDPVPPGATDDHLRQLAPSVHRLRGPLARALPRGRRHRHGHGMESPGRRGVRLAAGRGGRASGDRHRAPRRAWRSRPSWPPARSRPPCSTPS